MSEPPAQVKLSAPSSSCEPLWRAVWPLAALLVLDAFGGWGILALMASGDITDGIVAAYLSFGMVLIQLPLCMIGVVASRGRRTLRTIYMGHAIGSASLITLTCRDSNTFVREALADYVSS